MAIVKTISSSEFLDEFKAYDRQDNYSYYAKIALYEHYDEIGEDYYEDGKDYNLDVIDICCTWNECRTKEDTISEYGYLVDEKELRETFITENGLNNDLTDKEEKDLTEFIFDEVFQELEDNSICVIRINEQNIISPDMNVDGVLVHNF